MTNRQIRGIIFDVDGTIVDSELLHLKAWQKPLEQHNCSITSFPSVLKARMLGKKPLVNSSIIVKFFRLKISPETLLKDKTDIFINSLKAELKPMPGLLIALKNLKKADYRLAVCSSGQREYIYQILDKFNLINYFEVIITGEQVRHAKPNPESFLMTCKALLLEPNACIAVEDSLAGIVAAKRAGLLCFAIKNLALVQDLSGADKIIGNLQEITDEEINTLTKK